MASSLPLSSLPPVAVPPITLPRTGSPPRNLALAGLTLRLLGLALHRGRRADPVI